LETFGLDFGNLVTVGDRKSVQGYKIHWQNRERLYSDKKIEQKSQNICQSYFINMCIAMMVDISRVISFIWVLVFKIILALQI